MKAKKKEVKELAASSLGVDLSPKVLVKKLAEPAARKGGVKVQDVEELYKKLHEEAKVL
jgi:electron transfer flavoprotein beta subunit